MASEQKTSCEPRPLSKFEIARIVAWRALQLENDADPMCDIEDMSDALRIAMKEFDLGLLDMEIVRKMPNADPMIVSSRDERLLRY